MTTNSEVRKLCAPLLEGVDDVVYRNRGLIVLPVHHVLRTVFVDRTRFADYFDPVWYIQCLFDGYEGNNQFAGNWFYRLDRTLSAERIDYILNAGGNAEDPFKPQGAWNWNLPGVEDDFRWLVGEHLLPKLRALDTLEACLETQLAARVRIKREPGFFDLNYLLALGRLEELFALGPEIAWPNVRAFLNARVAGLGDRFFDQGPTIGAEDRQHLADWLHERELRVVRALKIEDLWERTPFPLELGL